jgi:hypothetical protein
VKYLTETGVDVSCWSWPNTCSTRYRRRAGPQVQVIAGTIQGQQVGRYNVQNNTW